MGEGEGEGIGMVNTCKSMAINLKKKLKKKIKKAK